MEKSENVKEKEKSLKYLRGCFLANAAAKPEICSFCLNSDICPVSDDDKRMFFSSNGDYEKYLEKSKRRKGGRE